MFQSRLQLNSPIANTKLAVSKIVGPQQSFQQLQLPKNKNNKFRNFGVNTSQLLVTQNSFQIIRPITHSAFPQIGKSGRQPTLSDGLDQQSYVPSKKIHRSPFNSSQHKQQIKKQTRYNNNICQFKIQKQMQQLKTSVNPQTNCIQNINNNCNKIRKIVNFNLKNIQTSLNQVRKSRTIYYKKHFTKQKCSNQEDKPISKKLISPSNFNKKISERKVTNQIKSSSVTKIKLSKTKDDQFSHFKEDVKTEVKSGQIQAQAPGYRCIKLNQIDYPEQEINFQPQSYQSNQQHFQSQKKIVQEIGNQTQLYIDLKTSISALKRILIQGQDFLQTQFIMPKCLLQTLLPNITNQQLKARMWQIFKYAEIQPHIITIKRFQDRIQLRCKNFCAIWYFEGKAYIGGWKGEKTLADLNKHGIGVQWSGKDQPSPYIYYGQFKDNKKQGYGLMKKQNNQVYVGCWKNNKKQGWGRLYGFDNKLKHNGEFNQNQFIN